MAVRRPLIWNASQGLIEMTGAQLSAVSSRVLDLFVANSPIILTVVTSGGNLGTISDTRKRASAVSIDNTDFLDPGAITDATPVDFSKIQQTIASVSAPTGDLPVYWDNTTGITEMSLTDFADTFLAYPFGLLTSGSVGNNSAGIYFISTANDVAGATKIGNVFIDTRANTAAYTAGEIPETRDQPTTITTYRLHRRDTFSTIQPYILPFVLSGSTGIQRYTKPAWEALLIENMRYHAVNTAGFRITYNIDGTGTASGSAMVNTVTTGNTVGERQVGDDYKSQRFPSGGNTTADTYQFKIRLN
jgi:hypothetical protein